MKYGVIYKITNPNGRIYIGQPINFTRRIKHYKEMEHSSRNNQPIISNSIRKYGFEAHNITIIADNIPEFNLDDEEIYWIKFYKSNIYEFPNNNGMNCTPGGGRMVWSEESLAKRSNIVYCYTLKGEFLCSYKSTSYAGKILKISPSHISACCRDILQRCGNYMFRYTYEEHIAPYVDSRVANKAKISKPVKQILNGEIIQIWESAKEAERSGNFSSSGIRDACVGRSSTHKGYKWEYLYPEDLDISTQKNSNTGLKKAIIQIDKKTGNIIAEYSCKSEAAKVLNLKPHIIQRILLGTRTSNDLSYTFKYK